MLQFMKKMDKPIKGKIASFFSKTVVKQIIIGIVFTISLYLITVGNIAPEKITVKIGDVAPDDIRATKDIIDENATERLKQEAMDRVESRYRVDTSIQVKVKNEIKKFFELTKEIQNMEEITLVKKAALLEQQSNIKLTENDYNAAIRLSDESLLTLESNIYEIVTQIMGFGIKEEELEYEKQNVAKNFDNLENLSNDAKTLGISIINLTIRPNWFLDIETTQQKKKEAAEQVPDVVIKEGQIIVEQKQIIDQKAFSLIKKSGLIKEAEGFDYSIIFGTLIIILIFEMIIIAYLYIFDKKVLYNSKLLLILSIIILSIIIISKSIYGISGYLVPISTATMLISLLINPKLAILTNLILSVIIGTITSNDLNMIIPLLIGGTAGVFAVINTHQRYNILLTGLLVSGINILIITAFGLIYNLELHELISRCIYGALNGLFSAILTIGSLPLWESLFGILTPLKLLELSNPNQPLLKKLLLEAPGTYHHSIVVGNLSETAAEAVDGSPLLARVGAYYHDVGKLKRPYFFKENQLNGENPHDKINPSLSTLIITNHTKDGVEFAQKYKLPMQIRDIIQQHHGETLVAYFYHKALNGDNANSVKPDTFRYDGPKPQTKEAAIVMLADSVEAAVRAMREPTKGKIEGLVRQIIKDKLNDGQLDECGLTLKDLSTIANSFVNVLMGIFHERIEYPKLDLAELKGGN
ncbi:HD family phosphohydrolase [Brassicibacter mesophilus]|uniref:HD family phosphohydrolase n=1 Tax=Brassicibacter mesophilus TaxID=745119 RepID=UPI003D1E8EA3